MDGVALLRSAPWRGVGRVLSVLAAFLHSAPVQGVSRPPHTASRDCRNDSPLARANPCAPAPECRDTQEKKKSGYRQTRKQTKGRQNNSGKERAATRISICVPTRSAASRAGMAGWAGEGGGLILPALAKSAPTLPSPPRHPGTARCAACGCADRNAGVFCLRIPVQAHTGSHGQGVSRSDNLCSQCAEDGSPLERAQSEVTPPLVRAHSAATPPQPGRPPTRGHARSITPLWSK